jgi:hypothetical protein
MGFLEHPLHGSQGCEHQQAILSKRSSLRVELYASRAFSNLEEKQLGGEANEIRTKLADNSIGFVSSRAAGKHGRSSKGKGLLKERRRSRWRPFPERAWITELRRLAMVSQSDLRHRHRAGSLTPWHVCIAVSMPIKGRRRSIHRGERARWKNSMDLWQGASFI